MFAQRADEVIRELVTFVDVAAYFADEAFFAIGPLTHQRQKELSSPTHLYTGIQKRL